MRDRLSKKEVEDLVLDYQSQLRKLKMQMSFVKSAIDDLKSISTPEEKAIRVVKSSRTDAPKKRRGRPAKPKAAVDPNAPKKKRGRPAKPKAAADPNAPKKRRGRPAKPKTASAATDAPKKRRGRPAKVKSSASLSQGSTLKKGRGRPKKIKTTVVA